MKNIILLQEINPTINFTMIKWHGIWTCGNQIGTIYFMISESEPERTASLQRTHNFDDTIQWRHNERRCISKHRQLDGSSSRSFRLAQRIHQSPPYRSFVKGIHRWLLDSPHKGPVTGKVFPWHGVIRQTIGHDVMMATVWDAILLIPNLYN